MSLFPISQVYYHVTGSYVRGEWVSAITGPLAFRGTIQPATADDIKSTEVARQDTGYVKVYTTTSMAVSRQGTANSGDVVLYDDQYWEIIQKLPHKSGLIPHNKYLAAIRPDFVPPVVEP